MTQMNLYMKQEQNQGHREQAGDCPGGGDWGKDGVECGVNRYTLSYIQNG